MGLYQWKSRDSARRWRGCGDDVQALQLARHLRPVGLRVQAVVGRALRGRLGDVGRGRRG
jgi:hypothetical protein